MTRERAPVFWIVAAILTLLASFMVALLMMATSRWAPEPTASPVVAAPEPSEAPPSLVGGTPGAQEETSELSDVSLPSGSMLVPASSPRGRVAIGASSERVGDRGPLSRTALVDKPRHDGGAPTTHIGEPLWGSLPDTATDVRGTASWYCGGGSACTRNVPPGTFAAAAGPALRVGDWRGRIVKVCGNDRCVKVALVDWCACPRRVIDLYRAAFATLASPSRGVLRVNVSWGGSAIVVPPTSTR